MPDGATAQDFCEYRLFFPEEVEHLLREKGFTVLGMYDNKELRESDLAGPTMYVVVRYGVEPGDAGDALPRD